MPTLTINLRRVTRNALLVSGLIGNYGMRLVGVTKCCQGDARVAKAMLDGAAGALADSRGESLAVLRRELPGAELQLLRPGLGDDEVGLGSRTASPDLCFVSSAEQARLMLVEGHGPQRFCLMVEAGDGREGVPVELLDAELERFGSLVERNGSGARLVGLAANLACARPAAPLERALDILAQALRRYKQIRGEAPRVVSCGGSGLLRLLIDDRPEPERQRLFRHVTELRCGEAILLGRIPSGHSAGSFLPGACRDAFMLEAPVLEVYEKEGRTQVLAGIGIQDVGHGPLVSLDEALCARRITSDYLVLGWRDDGAGGPPPRLGDRLAFIPTYYSLLAAMTSPFVGKQYC